MEAPTPREAASKPRAVPRGRREVRACVCASVPASTAFERRAASGRAHKGAAHATQCTVRSSGLAAGGRGEEQAGSERARLDEGRLSFCTVTHRDSPYRREWVRINDSRPSYRRGTRPKPKLVGDLVQLGVGKASPDEGLLPFGAAILRPYRILRTKENGRGSLTARRGFVDARKRFGVPSV